MPAPKGAQKKAAERAKLSAPRRVILTLDADEETIQRIAALCLLAKLPFQLEDAPDLGPLPWEDPTDPRFQKPPELELDHNAIRNNIVKLMTQWITAGRPRAELATLMEKNGGDRLSNVPNDHLMFLHDYLTDRLNPKETA